MMSSLYLIQRGFDSNVSFEFKVEVHERVISKRMINAGRFTSDMGSDR